MSNQDIESELHILEAERQRLKSALRDANKGVLASFHCPSSGEEFYLTKPEYADALERLDVLTSLQTAGPSNEQFVWSMGGYGIKEFFAYVVRSCVDAVVPVRLQCPRSVATNIDTSTTSKGIWTSVDNWHINLLAEANRDETSSSSSPTEARLYCVGPLRDDNLWAHQCVDGQQLALNYLTAVNEVPKVAALMGIQLATTLGALWLSIRLLRGAYRSYRLERRRRAAIRSTTDTQIESDAIGQQHEVIKLRRDRDIISGHLRWASWKMYFAMLLLLIIPSLSWWLSYQAKEEKSYSLVPLVMRGLSMLTGNGNPETFTSVAATLLLVKLMGVPLVGFAVHVMTKATGDLKTDTFKGALQRTREATMKQVAEQNSPLRKTPPLQPIQIKSKSPTPVKRLM